MQDSQSRKSEKDIDAFFRPDDMRGWDFRRPDITVELFAYFADPSQCEDEVSGQLSDKKLEGGKHAGRL